MSSTKKIKLSETSSSSRKFQKWWTIEYGVIERNNKAHCTLCDQQVVSRTWNVKRHFETNHSWLLEENQEERTEYVAQEVSKKTTDSQILLQFVSDLSDAKITTASFSVSHSIVKYGKPFSEGEFLKSTFLNCAPYLFDDFDNKEEIIRRINELPISRSIVKSHVLSMHSDIKDKIKQSLSECEYFSICLLETSGPPSPQLAIFARYFSGSPHELFEELLSLENLLLSTTGKDICDTVVKVMREINVNMSKIVSITTDGGPSVVSRNLEFVTRFTDIVGHSIVPLHCIVHREALYAKAGLKEFNSIITLVTKIVKLISARALHKREFNALLNEVESDYGGLSINNIVFSRGKILERFVGCLSEIKRFLTMKNIVDFPELDDDSWIWRLLFFTDISTHLNELNIKFRGFDKSIDIMLGYITAFEAKLDIFKRDLETQTYKYFPSLQKNFEEFNMKDKNVIEHEQYLFLSIISSIKNEFHSIFSQFRDLDEILLFVKYPDQANFSKMKMSFFEWLQIDQFEMELVELQSSYAWKQKFISLRSDLEKLEQYRLEGNSVSNQDTKLYLAWESLPETFGALKRLAKAVLTIFPSLYACDTLFSLPSLENDRIKRLADEESAACMQLKTTNYQPDIEELAAKIHFPKKN